MLQMRQLLLPRLDTTLEPEDDMLAMVYSRQEAALSEPVTKRADV